LRPYLDLVVIPQDAGADKPDRAIFDFAVSKAGIKPDEAVHVGDQYYIDADGAMKAGLKAILLDRLDLFPQYTTCPRVTSLRQVAEHL
jgi:putative hydrolase of the HAD superfamily